jgi:uncharacterized coiled-coil DUF342 family protein
MTPDQRLDQLEPMIADILEKQDNLSRQNKALVQMHFDLVMSQVQIKDDIGKVKNDIGQINNRLDQIENTVNAIYQAVQKPSGN